MIFDILKAPYNAAADGITDDTKSIQLAIDTAKALGGGTILFPANRTVVIASKLNIYANITLRATFGKAKVKSKNNSAWKC